MTESESTTTAFCGETNDGSAALLDAPDLLPAAPPPEPDTECYHCGTPVRKGDPRAHGKAFCCTGCLTVFELLSENGLTDFYRLGQAAGVRVKAGGGADEFSYLDAPQVRERLVDFTDEKITRVTFRLPAIHCVACIWLLENLFRLKPGIGQSHVNFPRKELSLTFQNAGVSLGEVAALLASLGYEPDLKLSDAQKGPLAKPDRRLWLQIGVAGFAFGNIMLFSISTYAGMDAFTGPSVKRMFDWLSFGLSLPVIFYSASDYWRAAWVNLRQRLLTIEVPIAAGIVALAVQSTVEVFAGRGGGYFDSLCGLVFFLLCGRLFQQRTYDRLVFDRDYTSFFPLSVSRQTSSREERVPLSDLRPGDELVIRNGELIPADARLSGGPALIDYSFVTGESEPVLKQPGDHLYAGGRQMGGAITVEITREVSQSYLTSLWNQDTFRKEKGSSLDTLTNQYSRRFTKAVLAIALGSAVFWWFRDPAIALRAFTSVLIVACPCALALAAPFVLGTAQRVLARRQVFLKNGQTLETLARVDAVVFDKTGTLTAAGAVAVPFQGDPLTAEEERLVHSLARHSTHPCSTRIASATAHRHTAAPVRSFVEQPGRGIAGCVEGREIRLGSAEWLAERGVPAPAPTAIAGSIVHLAIDSNYRGCFLLANALRPGTMELMAGLSPDYDLALLSGDHERERARLAGLFGDAATMRFNQSPLNKLDFIRQLQQEGKTVLMAGDGLNDAGALQQSDVGVAVVESIGAFSPASDVIMAAGLVPRLGSVLRFSRGSVRVVRLSFLISSLYNVAGISFAARGLLSPVICAILMPLSSVTVVAFACGLTRLMGWRAGFGGAAPGEAGLEDARA